MKYYRKYEDGAKDIEPMWGIFDVEEAKKHAEAFNNSIIDHEKVESIIDEENKEYKII